MQPVIYDDKFIEDLDGILAASAHALGVFKKAMALDEMDSDYIDALLALREDLGAQLSAYDRGLYIPEDKRVALADHEDDATTLLGKLQRDHQDYESHEIRGLRHRGLVARLRLLEMSESQAESGT